MNTRPDLKPECAFDVHEGIATPVADPWPGLSAPDGYRWVHLDLARAESADWLAESLPDIAASAILEDQTRPRFDLEEDGMLLNLREVNLNPGADADDMVSLRVWTRRDVVVSAHHRPVRAVVRLRQVLEKGTGPATPGAFLVQVSKEIVDRIEAESMALEDEVDALEDGAAGDIMPLRQRAIKLSRYVGPQRVALKSLAEIATPFFDDLERSRMREVANRATRTLEELDASRDRLIALQDHRDAEAQARFARNNYVLAVVAAIFLPLGFLTGLFGVNVGGMPGLHDPAAFAILTVALVLIGVVMVALFKFWRWF